MEPVYQQYHFDVEGKRTVESLNESIRKIPMIDRLKTLIEIIADLCKESRRLKMSIPVQPYDEDIFITETLRELLEIFKCVQCEKEMDIYDVTCDDCIEESI